MKQNKFLIADLHFNHKKMPEYRGFSSLLEMNEVLTNNWNAIVTNNDIVYVLGDVAINRSGLQFIPKLNGKKKLIKGNHDNFRDHEYLEFFESTHGSIELTKYNCILTHIPVHESQMNRYKINVHGHLHKERIKKFDTTLNSYIEDKRYICVSCEQINYTPINIDDIF